MARTATPRSNLRSAWAVTPVGSRIAAVEVETLRRWLRDLPPPPGYQVSGRPLRYRRAPHLAAFCSYEDRLITLQLPEPFRPFSERVYYRARRKPGSRIAFQWFAKTVQFRTRTEVLRFLYCHEFYHWYLREVLGRKSSAETACDRFALFHFRARHREIDWSAHLPGYSLLAARLPRSA